MTRFTAFSRFDIGLASLILIGIIGLWYVGDFHIFHHGDSVLFSLISLYRWTAFPWDQDHVGTLLPLAISPIHRPYWNLLALDGLCSFFFLSSFVAWGRLLLLRPTTWTENSVWAVLLVPLFISKGALFQNAAHSLTFGISLLFAALFVGGLLNYLKSSRPLHSVIIASSLLVLGFLSIYPAKNIIVPLAAVTAGLLWERVQADVINRKVLV